MRRLPLRERLPLVLSATALVVAVLGSTGPAIAHGVQHAIFAHNADKVDGRHAVGSAASVAARKGKLIATSPTTGYLPNNVIKKALDAGKLDGLNSNEFVRVAGSGNADDPTPITTDYEPVLTVQLTAPRKGFVLLTGTVSGISETPRVECQCAIFTRVRHASVPAGEFDLPYSVAYISSDVTPVETTATTAVVPVSRGLQRFILESQKWEFSGTGDIAAFSPTLTALYVPYGSAGAASISRLQAASRTLPAVVGGN